MCQRRRACHTEHRNSPARRLVDQFALLKVAKAGTKLRFWVEVTNFSRRSDLLGGKCVLITFTKPGKQASCLRR